MRRIMLTFVLCLLTVISLYSQDSYPKKISIDRDTIIAITPDQLMTINSKLLEKESLTTFVDSLESLMNYNRLAINKQIKLNRLINKKNRYLFVENSKLVKLNETNDKISKYLKQEIKIQKRKKLSVGLWGFTVGVATTSMLILILK